MAEIQYVNLHKLDPSEAGRMKAIVPARLEKVTQKIGDVSAVITVKKYTKRGSQPKYSIHCRLTRGSILLASKASDWDLATAVHKATNKLMAEAEHRFKLKGKMARATKRPMKGKRR